MRVVRGSLALSLAVSLLLSAASTAGAAPIRPPANGLNAALCAIVRFAEAQVMNPAVLAQLRAVEAQVCPPRPVVGITLTQPAAGATIPQDDQSTGCTYDHARGYGYRLSFSRTAPSVQVASHEVILQHGTSPAAVDETVTTTSFNATECNSFVTDNNRTGWHWQVNGLNSAQQVVATSEQRAISFGTCRLIDGRTPCFAPS